jgi:hypothetical protein
MYTWHLPVQESGVHDAISTLKSLAGITTNMLRVLARAQTSRSRNWEVTWVRSGEQDS